MVELVLFVVETADQCLDGTITRVHRHERAFNFGQLGYFPCVLDRAGNANDRATADLDIGWRLVRQAGLGRLEAFARDFNRLGVLAHGLDRLGVGLQHHG